MNRIVDKYCDDVLAGRETANLFVRLAVERHLKDLETGKDRGLFFDPAAGQKVIDFFSWLCHHKGTSARKPFILQPHQQFYFSTLFGWKRDDEFKTRRFRKSYKEIARKNGKTTEAAGKSMCMSLVDGEIGAQNYFVATKEEQARIGFEDVSKIIMASPIIQPYFKIYKKAVEAPVTQSFIRPLGSDSDTQDGFDPYHVTVDEYHAHPSDKMLNVMESGMGARSQPMIDIITTAGFNKEYPCYHFRKNVIDILEGRIENDSIYGLIFTLDEEDDWRDEEVYRKANPNLGVSVGASYMKDRRLEAIQQGGEKEIDFKTKNLNIWTNADKTWIQDEIWQKLGQKGANWTEYPCYGGFDLALVNDLTCLSLVFELPNGLFATKCFTWMPEETVRERVKRGLHSLTKWIEEGWVRVTPGNVTDFEVIKQDIAKICQQYKVKSIAYDRNYAPTTPIAIWINENVVPVTPFSQNIVSYSLPTKTFERLVRTGELIHDANPVMRWMLSSVQIKRDANDNVKPDKDQSSRFGGKIDGIVATIMAIGEQLTFADQEDFQMW